MELILSWALKIGFLALAAGSVVAVKKCLKLKDDNAYEEVVEQVIKDQTGVDIDITPETPEEPMNPKLKKSADVFSNTIDALSKDRSSK